MTKLEIYKEALELAKADYKRKYYVKGICNYMQDVESLYHIALTLIPFIFDKYPKFKKYKPKNQYDGLFWFPQNKEGLQNRIDILKTVIKELEQ